VENVTGRHEQGVCSRESGDVRKRRRWPLHIASAGIFFLALWVRVGFLDDRDFDWAAPPESDGVEYDIVAVNLLRERSFTGPWHRDICAGYPDAPRYEMVRRRAGAIFNGGVRAPGYPLFLAAVYSVFGRDFRAVHVLQVGMSALTCVLLFLLGRRMFGLWVGLLAAVALSLDTAQAIIAGRFFNETLVHLIFMAAMIFMAMETATRRLRFAFLAGLFMGMATETRWNFFLAAAMVGLWFLGRAWREKWRRRALAAGGCYVAGLALIMIPWTVRQTASFGSFCLLSPMAGVGFAYGNASENFNAPPQKEGGWVRVPARRFSGTPLERNRLGWRLGLEGLRQNARRVPEHLLRKLGQAYRLDRVVPFKWGALRRSLRRPFRILWAPFLVGALLLLIRPGRRWLPLALLGQHLAIVIFFGMDRFLWPFHGAIFLCAAFALACAARAGGRLLRRLEANRA